MIVPIILIGLASSVLTEILKLFPILNASDTRKRIVAFGVAIILSVIYVISREELRGLDAVALVGAVVGASFVIYKSIIQIVRPPVSEKE